MPMAPHPFSLRQLQYVVAVADELSFRKASERCHVSQPALSAQLSQMEDVLGVRLFERDRRRVLPTAAGKEIIERARGLLRDADELVNAARRVTDPLTGSLRIGVIPTIAPYLLPSVTPALREKFPELIAVWVEDKTDSLVRGLEAGTLDAALLALEADLGEVEHEVVAKDPFMLAARFDDPLGARSKAVAPGELKDAQVLLLDDGHCFREQALAYCSRAKARELEFRGTSLSTLAQMVVGGAGVTLLPQLAVATELQRADLHVRAFASPQPSRTLALIWRKRSPIAKSLRSLAAVIRRAYPSAAAQTAGKKTAKKRGRRARANG